MRTTILKSRRALVGGAATAVLAAVGVGLAAAPASAATESAWDKVAQCESSGNWSIDTGNGYYGGLQFSLSTWRAYGGTGLPSNASKATQIAIAEKVLAGQGWNAWPVCSVQAGVRGQSASTASHPVAVRAATKAAPKKAVHHVAVHHVALHHVAAKHVAAVRTSGRTYTVKSGDTLGGIAAALHVAGGWERLADANLHALRDPDVIFPGQVLHLPA